MAHAYTPGLKVSASETVRKERRLPLPGDVLVQEGDLVEPHQVVARTDIPGDPESLNIANLLGVEPEDIGEAMLVQEGDEVEKGQIIARTIAFFGLLKNEQRAPVSGTVEMISGVSGQVVFRAEPTPLEVEAYISGRVREVMPNEGVVIETAGAFIQGIFGVGGERLGEISILADAPDQQLDASAITEACRDKIIVIGSLASSEILHRAADVGAVGVVAGGVIDEDLVDYLGYDIGVAITGHEKIPVTLVLTEGFGPVPIADKTFELLQELEGRIASMSGATQIRAGVMRPEIICPDADLGEDFVDVGGDELAGGLVVGTPIRIIRQPYFGYLAEVTELPSALQEVESEATVRVLRARLMDGTEVLVPRANVEIIEGRSSLAK